MEPTQTREAYSMTVTIDDMFILLSVTTILRYILDHHVMELDSKMTSKLLGTLLLFAHHITSNKQCRPKDCVLTGSCLVLKKVIFEVGRPNCFL